jgi:hypothetical protein
VIGTFHATPSWLTLEDLIEDCTSRVPASSPLGCVHPAAAADVELPLDGVVVVPPDVVVALDVPVDVLDDVTALDAVELDDKDDDDFVELPPQPASSAITATTTTGALKIWRRPRRLKTLIQPPHLNE